jgi:hypothetical protein
MGKKFTKITQSSTVILIFWIVVYGIVYAQQACCSTIVDACIPAFSKISDSYTVGSFRRTSPSHHRNNKLQSNLCSKNIPADFGEGNICCETNRCDSDNKTTFSLSFIQDLYPLQKSLSAFNVISAEQTNFEPKSLSLSRKAVPIYILTQSIIC